MAMSGDPKPQQGSMRLEHDLLGQRLVPAEAYWGVHTLRALENFPITQTPISTYPGLLNALVAVKASAAKANLELGLLDATRADAIVRACREIREGALHDQFVVDVIQGGAGTSTNMNVNEVVANRALELLGHERGQYEHLHPLEDVNRSQSTNDVYPTAIKVALHWALTDLMESMEGLHHQFAKKADEFVDLVKVGRTQLQDAVPMTLGQEFAAFGIMVEEDRLRVGEAQQLLREINLGATAIGTGINCHPDYPRIACAYLAEAVDIDVMTASHLVEATQDAGALVQVSGVLKRVAVKLSKICNDLRLLSSGPQAGLCEITLPAVQAGSSIMPGKVNPVIPEVVNQVAFEVIGNDVTVTLAAEGGQLQLNAFEPIIVHSLLKSVSHLRVACDLLATRCVAGITANRERLSAAVEHSVGVITALSHVIGYDTATRLAREAMASGAPVYELVNRERLMDETQLKRLLRPENLTSPRADGLSTMSPEAVNVTPAPRPEQPKR